MPKRKQDDEYIEDPATGRRWPVVIETVDGNRVRGFYVGEPHKSAFFSIGPVADKRGVTDRLKRHVLAESSAQAASREAYEHPLAPSKRPTKPRAKQTPAPAWGTLDWYRNELAMAQDRIRLLESECDALLAEKRERDPVMLYVVNGPRAIARENTGPRRSKHASEYPKWEEAALDALRRKRTRGLTGKRIVSSVMLVAARGVTRTTVNGWWDREGDRIRAEAQRRWPDATQMFGSLKAAKKRAKS